jgi:hypothetical protein
MRLCVAASSRNVHGLYHLQLKYKCDILTDSHWTPTDYFDQLYIVFAAEVLQVFFHLYFFKLTVLDAHGYHCSIQYIELYSDH